MFEYMSVSVDLDLPRIVAGRSVPSKWLDSSRFSQQTNVLALPFLTFSFMLMLLLASSATVPTCRRQPRVLHLSASPNRGE